MKAIIEYNLDDPNDRDRYAEFNQLPKLLSFIGEFEQQMRAWRKHADVKPDFDEIDDRYFQIKNECLYDD